MYEQLIMAIVFGLVGGIVPGPVLTATFTEILQGGFFKSLRIVGWAMLAETVVALISLVALSYFGLPLSFFNILSVIGAGVLIWIAIQLWDIRTLDTDQKVHFSPSKITAMILANGVLWTFWATVCIPKAIALDSVLPYGKFVFLASVEVGWLISTIAVAFVFSWFRTYLSNPKVIPYIFRVFALIFVYFALTMLYGSFVYFTQ